GGPTWGNSVAARPRGAGPLHGASRPGREARARTTGSRGVRRLDLQLAGDDLLLVLLDLVDELLRHLTLEVVEGGQAHALVLQRPDVRLIGEVARGSLADGVLHGGADALHHRGEHVLA